MLNDEVPIGVIHSVVEVSNCDLNSPVFFVIDLYVPVDFNRAHVVCTSDERCETVLVSEVLDYGGQMRGAAFPVNMMKKKMREVLSNCTDF